MKYITIVMSLCALAACSSQTPNEDRAGTSVSLVSPPKSAANIVSWNAREIFYQDSVSKRRADFMRLGETLAPDILILQEFTNCEQLPEIASLVAISGASFSCSDFNENNDNKYGSFELGVISRFPVTRSLEYEFYPEAASNGTAKEMTIPDTSDMTGIDQSKTSSRGYLWTEIESINLVVINIHLKSSRGDVGQKDRDNAKKRERVAASIYKSVTEHQSQNPNYNYLIAGDFNVGHSDNKKNGDDLINDCYENCGSKDLYDETHYIFRELAGMTNVTYSIKDSTYPAYPGSPIDNIYVSDQRKFGEGKSSQSTFGSDHKSVYVTYQY